MGNKKSKKFEIPPDKEDELNHSLNMKKHKQNEYGN